MFVQWWCWAKSCARIGLSVAIVPSRPVGSFRISVDIVLAIDSIVPIVCLFVGDMLC